MPYTTPFAKAITDWDGWVNSLHPHQRDMVDYMFRFVPPEEAETERQRLLGASYLADKLNRDIEEMSLGFEFFRDAYAIHPQGLGLTAPPANNGEFLKAVRERMAQDEAHKLALQSAAAAGMRSALLGGDDDTDYAAWVAAQSAPLPPNDMTRRVWRMVRTQTRAKLGADGMAAALQGVRALRFISGVSHESDAWFNEARRSLVAIAARDPEKYDHVLAAMQAQAGVGPKDAGKGFLQGMGEKAARSVGGIAQGALNATQIFGARLVEAGLTNSSAPMALAAQIRAGITVDGDLRKLLDGEIDPVMSKQQGWLKWVEDGAYMFAGSAPYMVAAMVPGGQAALIGSFTNDAYLDLRAAGWEGPGAEAAAFSSGVIQAGIERASEVIMKVPGVAGVLAKWGVKPGTPWLVQYLTRSGARAGTEVAEEFAQQLTTPAIHELSAAIFTSVPDTLEGRKLKDIMARFLEADNAMPLLISVLPLGLLGAGLTKDTNSAAIAAVTRDKRLLSAIFSEADANALLNETDPAKSLALLQQLWRDTPAEVIGQRVRALVAADQRLALDHLREVGSETAGPLDQEPVLIWPQGIKPT